MTEDDKDRQLLAVVKELRGLHAEAGPLRVEHEWYLEQLREVCCHLTSTPCPLRVPDGRLVDGKGADVVSGGVGTSFGSWAACVMWRVVWRRFAFGLPNSVCRFMRRIRQLRKEWIMRPVSRLLVVPVLASAWLGVIAPIAPEAGQEVPAIGSVGGELAWKEPGVVFEPDVARSFIRSDFLPQAETLAYPENTVLAFSGDTCPPGWEQLTASEDAAPLFYAFGLLVDAGGVPRSEYVRVPACVKQQ